MAQTLSKAVSNFGGSVVVIVVGFDLKSDRDSEGHNETNEAI